MEQLVWSVVLSAAPPGHTEHQVVGLSMTAQQQFSYGIMGSVKLLRSKYRF